MNFSACIIRDSQALGLKVVYLLNQYVYGLKEMYDEMVTQDAAKNLQVGLGAHGQENRCILDTLTSL